MTDEELLHLARLLGLAEPEELTFGELAEEAETALERERRFYQNLSGIAYVQAALTARALTGERLPPMQEAFPFWTEEERKAAKVARIRERMECLAGEPSAPPSGDEKEENTPNGRPK